MTPDKPLSDDEIVEFENAARDRLMTLGWKTVVRLCAELRRARSEIERARTYIGIEGYPCPLCHIENGKFLEPCEMHRHIDTLDNRAEVDLAKCREVLRACADELENYVENEYAMTKDTYPDQMRKYQRDIATVLRARALLPPEDAGETLGEPLKE
jgi:hypothetical protein